MNIYDRGGPCPIVQYYRTALFMCARMCRKSFSDAVFGFHRTGKSISTILHIYVNFKKYTVTEQNIIHYTFVYILYSPCACVRLHLILLEFICVRSKAFGFPYSMQIHGHKN